MTQAAIVMGVGTPNGVGGALAARFAAQLGDGRFAPAAIQGWLLANASDCHAAAEADGLMPSLTVAAE